MKNVLTRIAFSASFVLSCIVAQAQCPNLVWSDEFDGNSLDLNKWSYQTGDGCSESICGWGNNELQIYDENSVSVGDGLLKITASRVQLKGRRYQYNSGRIRSINKGDWTYGRFEASIKLPQGGGLWPAFWMLSTNEPYGEWPQSGEIDIMEFVGNSPEETLGYIHYGDPYPNNQQQGTSFPFYDPNFLSEFHEYAIEWNPGEIKWFVDGNLFQTKTPDDLGSFNWPFDQDMHFLLNVAIGGNLGGEVDDSIFPQAMEVDYVRVYSGGTPYISGDRFVEYQGRHSYEIGNVSGGTNVTWSVPAGATIVSGQGTPNVVIDYGTSTGQITAQVSTSCGTETLTMNTSMAPPYTYDFSFENFDQPGSGSYSSSDGTLTEVANPNPNSVNSSSLSGEYVRNSSAQYDNIVYSTSAVTNAAQYVFGEKRFYMDVLTSAPVGTEIIIQLETSLANSTNYPDGRHSRYFGVTRETNAWHRVYFDFADRPDFGEAPDDAISNLLVLFNSNTLTGDTYYFDNLDSYTQGGGSGGNNPPSVSISSPSDGSSFDEGQTVSITANASDSDGTVSQVEFFVDGSSIGVDASSPYTTDWVIPNGTFMLTAEATDNEGAKTTSSAISVTGQAIGNSAPSVSITSPSDGSTFDDGQNVAINANASDSDGSITQVEFFVDGSSIGVDTTSPYSTNWTISAGSFTLTAEATDNAGAKTLSSAVNVTGQATGSATEIYVNSIVTSTQDASRGNKRGAATVTIYNNLGQPEANASVTGTFNGTFNETVSGTTGSDGSVTLVTSGTAKGGVTVNLCVDNVSHGSLSYNSSSNVVTCSGSSARVSGGSETIAQSVLEEEINEGIVTFPNPFRSTFQVRVSIESEKTFSAKLFALDGRLIDTISPKNLERGHHNIRVNLSDFESGVYFFESQIGDTKHVARMLKH